MTNVYDLPREQYIALIAARIKRQRQQRDIAKKRKASPLLKPRNTPYSNAIPSLPAREAVFHRPLNSPVDPLFDDNRLPERTRLNNIRVLRAHLAPSTLPTYGTGVRNFVAWCGGIGLQEQLVFPAPEHILTSYACALAGSVAKSTARNYLAGVRAWHLVHGAGWNTSPRLEMALKAIGVLAPEGKPPRLPITRHMLELLASHLDHSKPDQACALALACAAFWSQSRLGELTSTRAHSFDEKRVFKRSHLGNKITAQGTIILNYPWTKTKGFTGEQSILNRQQGATDPIAALENHLKVNDIPAHLPLFSFHVASGWQCMTKAKLLHICNAVWTTHDIPRITGHSFRIGGTTELLQAGVSPAIVQVMGRWSSDAFLRYWRHLDIIIPLHAENLASDALDFFASLEKDGAKKKSARGRRSQK